MAVYRKGIGTFSSLDRVRMSQAMVRAGAAVLSFLTVPEQRMIFLERYQRMLKTYEARVDKAARAQGTGVYDAFKKAFGTLWLRLRRRSPKTAGAHGVHN